MNLLSNLLYFLLAAFFVLGIYGIIVKENLIKQLMAMNVMQVAVIAYFLTVGQKFGSTVPIFMAGLPHAQQYVNPLPHALMLTAIVVSLSTAGVALALISIIQREYKSIEEPKIMRGMNQ